MIAFQLVLSYMYAVAFIIQLNNFSMMQEVIRMIMAAVLSPRDQSNFPQFLEPNKEVLGDLITQLGGLFNLIRFVG